MPDPKLPSRRVEFRRYPDESWNVLLYRMNGDLSTSVTFYWSRRSAMAAARRWSIATGWPLVVDGKVIEAE